MAKATPLKRTSGITSRSTLNRQKTPYPLPDQLQRTPLAPVPNTAGPKGYKKGFSGLDIDTDEEVEEPLEMCPPREATVKLEKKTPGRKRRNLVEHSSFSDLLVPTPGPSISKRMKEDPKPEENTPKPSRRSTRTTKPFPADSPAPQGIPTPADSHAVLMTPQKDIIFKVPLAPAKPKKTPPLRPPPQKRSSANKSAPGSIPSNQPVPERIKVGESKDKVITEMKDFGVPKNQEIGMGFFVPDGITRDIYVQASKIIVKVKVEKAIYPDGSLSEPSEEIAAHIASTLEYFMIPFLHKLTFRHTDPMEDEYHVKDLPIMYHIQRQAHGAGNTFKRSKTESCWMWNEIVIITPYLMQGSNKDP